MKQKVHLLDPDIASIVGVNAALVYNKILYYCEYHAAEGTNCHDGLHWSYNTHKGMAKQFKYLTPRQIRTALSKLIDKRLILVGNYNKFANDRTLWYAVNPDFHLTSKSFGNDTEVISDLTSKSNAAYDTEVTPLPIDTNKPPPKEEEANVDFNDFWSKYPRTFKMDRGRSLTEWLSLTATEKRHAVYSIKPLSSDLKKMQGGGYMPYVYLRDRIFNRIDMPSSAPVRSYDIPEEGTVHRELYDLVIDKYGEPVWNSWFNSCCLGEGDNLKTIYPSSKFKGTKLEALYSSVLKSHGFEIAGF